METLQTSIVNLIDSAKYDEKTSLDISPIMDAVRKNLLNQLLKVIVDSINLSKIKQFITLYGLTRENLSMIEDNFSKMYNEYINKNDVDIKLNNVHAIHMLLFERGCFYKYKFKTDTNDYYKYIKKLMNVYYPVKQITNKSIDLTHIPKECINITEFKSASPGANGYIYTATHKETKAELIIKISQENSYKFIINEATILNQLDNPGIIKMYHGNQKGKTAFLIMEKMDHDLGKFMQIPIKIALNYLQQILKAVAYLHDQGYVHQDLKPQNILVKNDVIKLADFGTCRHVSKLETFTYGTLWYRSPELLLGWDITKAVDIWAVGCIFLELLLGYPVFCGYTPITQLAAISNRLNLYYLSNKYTEYENEPTIDIFARLLENITCDINILDLIKRMLAINHGNRITAADALKHKAFNFDNKTII